MASGALGTQEGIGYTLYYATNFIFTGLAVAVAYHAGLFNIGAEGQAFVGGTRRGACLFVVGRVAVLGRLAVGGARRCGLRGGLGVYTGVSAGEAREPHCDHRRSCSILSRRR